MTHPNIRPNRRNDRAFVAVNRIATADPLLTIDRVIALAAVELGTTPALSTTSQYLAGNAAWQAARHLRMTAGHRTREAGHVVRLAVVDGVAYDWEPDEAEAKAIANRYAAIRAAKEAALVAGTPTVDPEPGHPRLVRLAAVSREIRDAMERRAL